MRTQLPGGAIIGLEQRAREEDRDIVGLGAMGLARQFGKILGSAPRVAAGGLVEIAPKDETLGIARRRIGDQQVELLDGRVLGVPILRLDKIGRESCREGVCQYL